MNKLEVGMYVRTKKGNIYKFETNNSMAKNGAKKYMVNCSYNIIDLIQVGDYVNGDKVGYIDDCDGVMREYYYDYEDASIDVGHWFEEIRTIVTKEQFKSMEYRLGDK